VLATGGLEAYFRAHRSRFAMARKAKPLKAKKLRRNPHARALGTALFRARVVKRPDVYRRRPKHARPPEPGGDEA